MFFDQKAAKSTQKWTAKDSNKEKPGKKEKPSKTDKLDTEELIW